MIKLADLIGEDNVKVYKKAVADYKEKYKSDPTRIEIWRDGKLLCVKKDKTPTT
jgi:hypothetical protein